MEGSYIIRIYRKDTRQNPGRRAHDRTALMGSVESVVSGEQRSFHDCDELWTYLVGMTGEWNGKKEDRQDES